MDNSMNKYLDGVVYNFWLWVAQYYGFFDLISDNESFLEMLEEEHIFPSMAVVEEVQEALRVVDKQDGLKALLRSWGATKSTTPEFLLFILEQVFVAVDPTQAWGHLPDEALLWGELHAPELGIPKRTIDDLQRYATTYKQVNMKEPQSTVPVVFGFEDGEKWWRELGKVTKRGVVTCPWTEEKTPYVAEDMPYKTRGVPLYAVYILQSNYGRKEYKHVGDIQVVPGGVLGETTDGKHHWDATRFGDMVKRLWTYEVWEIGQGG